MHREAPGIATLVIGAHLGCCIDPALMQAKARAALALARRTHPLCRIRSAGFAGPTGAFLECFHSNKCNMLRLFRPPSTANCGAHMPPISVRSTPAHSRRVYNGTREFPASDKISVIPATQILSGRL